jgi:hypothetical protein
MPAISKLFGGKGHLKPHEGHAAGNGFEGDQHGLHGAAHKAPSKAPKSKKK